MLRYVIRHWRGELGPAATWWLNCVAPTLILWWLYPSVAQAFDFTVADTRERFLAALVLQTVQIGIVPLWQMVGLWRCGAGLWQAGRPTPARLTQMAGVVFTLLIAMRGLVFGAEAVIGARVAFAIGPYDWQVSLLPGGRVARVSGGLGFGVSDALAQLLDANPTVRRIELHSGGGALSEGVRLRELIRLRALDTYTRRECSSACVSAYVGGRFRYLQRGARIGLHLPRNWQLLSSDPVAGAYAGELQWFRSQGTPDWFLARWVQTGGNFWYPTAWQLRQAGIVTTIRGPVPEATAG